MKNYEQMKMLDCIANIIDKACAIRNELYSGKQNAEYILEKIEPLIWDAHIIEHYYRGGTNERLDGE